MVRPILLIHGGAGVIEKRDMSAEYEKACRDALDRSLRCGYEILKNGGTALDAVIAAVVVMEDDEHFNAGKGSVFSRSTIIEMDAGIMDGSTGKAGGVSGVSHVKNPIVLAQQVMEKTPHTILCGTGAEDFARSENVPTVGQLYFHTQRRYEQLQRFLEAEKAAPGTVQPQLDHNTDLEKLAEKDTVGAVALDASGRLASASSTGGLNGKMAGRQSDSSVPGAGFWADSKTAVSMTGNGDYFLRRAASHEIASVVKYSGLSTRVAAEKVIFETLKDCQAGAIVLDSESGFCMPYNTAGMYRGSMIDEDKVDVKIWEY